MLLQIRLVIIFSTFNCIPAGLLDYNPSLYENGAKKREIRSSDCGNCELNVHEKYHQTFNAPVDFNQYIINNCCNGDGCTCTPRPGQPPIPTPPPVIPAPTPPTPAPPPPTPAPTPAPIPVTTSAPSTVKGNKTKKFLQKFRTDQLGLDLYYLMDGTHTFQGSRRELAAKATQFIESFKTLSSDYQLGLGVFVDKAGKPGRDKENETDTDPSRTAINGYGLWNLVPLTKNLQNFSRVVNSIETVNSGLREDALSGLHQSAVCGSKIGWRQNTKRFILLTTDQRYYMAGDKTKTESGQPVKPFNATCHLNAQNKYNGPIYDNSDYPSVGQLQSVIKETGTTIIMAIGQDKDAPSLPNEPLVIDTYKNLAKILVPKPEVAKLVTNSTTIIDDIIGIIRNAYQESSKDIDIETTITGPRDHVQKVVFTTKCLSKTVNITNSNGIIHEICEVPTGGVVDYEVEVTLPCPWTHSDVKLTSDILGQSGSSLDLASVCN